jgi:hypothetical protein
MRPDSVNQTTIESVLLLMRRKRPSSVILPDSLLWVGSAIKRAAPDTRCYQRCHREQSLGCCAVQTHFETGLSYSAPKIGS